MLRTAGCKFPSRDYSRADTNPKRKRGLLNESSSVTLRAGVIHAVAKSPAREYSELAELVLNGVVELP